MVMGDSAGGNLATVITQRRREAHLKPDILGQVRPIKILFLVVMIIFPGPDLSAASVERHAISVVSLLYEASNRLCSCW